MLKGRGLCGPCPTMTYSSLLCALRAHRYRYVGVLLGQGLERCERCGKVRTRPLSPPNSLRINPPASRGAHLLNRPRCVDRPEHPCWVDRHDAEPTALAVGKRVALGPVLLVDHEVA